MKETNLKHAAIPPEVPGSGTGREVSTLREDLARLAANQVIPTVIELKDINAAAYVIAKGFYPTFRQKGSEIYFVFPENKVIKLHLEIFKGNPSIAMASSVGVLRMLEELVVAMRK